MKLQEMPRDDDDDDDVAYFHNTPLSIQPDLKGRKWFKKIQNIRKQRYVELIKQSCHKERMPIRMVLLFRSVLC
jgi:hypothetical protein